MRSRITAIILLTVTTIYVLPVYSMHICSGQEHHHGNCDGNMHHGKQKEQEAPYKFKKAKHLDCYHLKKANNPCIGCKLNIPVQQLALLVAVFNFQPAEQEPDYKQEYHPPPNKEPPPEQYRIRPPPFTCV